MMVRSKINKLVRTNADEPRIMTITPQDLNNPPKRLGEILAPDKLARLPEIFAMHGTTASSAKEIIGPDYFDAEKLKDVASKICGESDAFYFYTTSGRGFKRHHSQIGRAHV